MKLRTLHEEEDWLPPGKALSSVRINIPTFVKGDLFKHHRCVVGLNRDTFALIIVYSDNARLVEIRQTSQIHAYPAVLIKRGTAFTGPPALINRYSHAEEQYFYGENSPEVEDREAAWLAYQELKDEGLLREGKTATMLYEELKVAARIVMGSYLWWLKHVQSGELPAWFGMIRHYGDFLNCIWAERFTDGTYLVTVLYQGHPHRAVVANGVAITGPKFIIDKYLSATDDRNFGMADIPASHATPEDINATVLAIRELDDEGELEDMKRDVERAKELSS